ncbi:MAG: hypothetical protein IPP83_04150 [Flavobacteriales bacterium]|nr:hypothetical protein [Flavobacteriales bacterium]
MIRILITLLVIWLASATAVAQRLLPQSTRISSGGRVDALAVYNDLLVVGGHYSTFNEHTRNNLQGWDGVNHFDLPGAYTATGDEVRSMLVHNGDLIVAGIEGNFGNVARWDGSIWHAMGTGLPTTPVNELVSFNGEIIAGAGYGTVYRWDGTEWTVMGQPLATAQGIVVLALAIHQGDLYAGGAFPERIVRWSGNTWESVPPGVDEFVYDLLSTPEGLLIVGAFQSDASGTIQFPYYARYDGSTFTAPYGDIGTGQMERILHGPEGSLIFGSYNYRSKLLTGAEVGRLGMQRILSSAEYQGELYVGGIGEPSRSDTMALAILEDGMEYTILDANNAHVRISPSTGMFGSFTWPGPESPFAVPAESNLSPMTSWLPLFSGEVADTFHLQAPSKELDRIGGVGPHADMRDLDYYKRYQRIWRIEREMIENHILHFNDPGYEMPDAIATWPGNGITANGEPAQLAPFSDLNSNGVYEPESGEYPLVRGDVAVYYIQSDSDDDTWYPQRALLDRHIMHYAFRNSWDPYLNQTTFTNIKLVNRSNSTYENARFGAETRFAIGCSQDDLAGCDTTLNLRTCLHYRVARLSNKCIMAIWTKASALQGSTS